MTRYIPFDLDCVVTSSSTVVDVISAIESSGEAACAIYVEDNRFVDILTNGDIRRFLLRGCSLSEHIDAVLEIKYQCGTRNSPVTCSACSDSRQRKDILLKNKVRQLVVVDENCQPLGLEVHSFAEDIDEIYEYDALIMAGGFGTRLSPLTDKVPKPMLCVAGKPMLERTVCQLRDSGVSHIYISVHYLPEIIKEYFDDGEKFGVEISYLHEAVPLGTGGCLSLLGRFARNLFVINGDIQTKLDIAAFRDRHVNDSNVISVCCTQHSYQAQFGEIIEVGGKIVEIKEKPVYRSLVNAGIYMLSPEVYNIVGEFEGPFSMVDLVEKSIGYGHSVGCFPIYETWLDVGRLDDFKHAQKIFT